MSQRKARLPGSRLRRDPLQQAHRGVCAARRSPRPGAVCHALSAGRRPAALRARSTHGRIKLRAWALPSSPNGFLAVSELRKRKGAHAMATYISLCHYTAEGIKEIKEAPKRLDKAKALARKLGGEMKKLYLTM